MAAKDKLIIALDVETPNQALDLVKQLHHVAGMFKVGSQLFTAAGPQIVRDIIALDSKVFLDLKFHDIPHQVAGAARSAAELGVSLFTIHASGGSEMMRRAWRCFTCLRAAAQPNRQKKSRKQPGNKNENANEAADCKWLHHRSGAAG